VSEERDDERRRRRELVEELEQRAEHARRLLDDIEERRQEAERQGLNFTAPTAEQLRKKLARAESPMIVGQGWSGSAAPGGVINYDVYINNPDPVYWSWLFVHVFVGPANVVPDVADAVSAVDPRFPRLTMPQVFGLSLAPGDTQPLSFALDVPAGVERSNYLGNAILFQGDWHDVGKYLDRGLFVFEVT
jgi:hypothetical protein